MSRAEEESPKRSSFWRNGLPWVILMLGCVGVTLAWLWPGERVEQVYRVIATYVVTFVSAVLLLGWLVTLSSFGRQVRWLALGTSAVAVGAVIATYKVEELRFSGDLWPVVPLRWATSADDLLERHRQAASEPVPALVADLSGTQPGDYPEYRGRKRDGVVLGPELKRDWTALPPKQLWRQPVGAGYAAFAIAGNLAVTLEQRRDQEAIVGYDTATGRERWVFPYPALFNERMGGKGPRSTPTIADGEVYALGATGKLHCLDARTGKPKPNWPVDVLKDNANVSWGMTGSPLIVDDLVVVNPGVQRADAPGGTLMAYERATGKLRWHAGRAHAGYNSPMLVTLAGRRQIVLFDGEGLAGYDPTAKEKQLWRLDWATQENINVAQPLVFDGDRLFISSGYGVGCAMLQLKNSAGKWSVDTVWKNLSLRCKFANPVAHDGHIYGLDDGVLVCLDVAKGKRKWRGERFGHGQLLLSDGLLIVLSEGGELALVEASPQDYRELGRLAALDGNTWNLPALADGRLYIRNDREMAAYDLRK